MVLGAGLEPAQPLWSQDFKSCVSTIPPSEHTLSGRRDSNPRPRPWQGRALPTELLPQIYNQKFGSLLSHSFFETANV